MRQAREFPTLVSCLGKIYALGGRDDSGTLASVEVYDPTTNQWSAVSPMVHKSPQLYFSLMSFYSGSHGVKRQELHLVTKSTSLEARACRADLFCQWSAWTSLLAAGER